MTKIGLFQMLVVFLSTSLCLSRFSDVLIWRTPFDPIHHGFDLETYNDVPGLGRLISIDCILCFHGSMYIYAGSGQLSVS